MWALRCAKRMPRGPAFWGSLGGVGVIFFLLQAADPRRSWKSRFISRTPRPQHRLTLFLLQNHQRQPYLQEGALFVAYLQEGALFVANGGGSAENSSKKSKKYPEEICDPINTVLACGQQSTFCHEALGTHIPYASHDCPAPRYHNGAHGGGVPMPPSTLSAENCVVCQFGRLL